jgi:hypothetical protein
VAKTASQQQPKLFSDAIAAAVDTKALAAVVDSHTNSEVQDILASRMRRGIPGGLGDSRALRARVHADLTEQMTAYVASLVAEAFTKAEGK